MSFSLQIDSRSTRLLRMRARFAIASFLVAILSRVRVRELHAE
jgi:hypothetical protein